MSTTTDDVIHDDTPEDGAAPNPTPRGLGAVVPTRRSVGIAVLVTGILGFVASSTLAIEKIELLTNPNYRPSCSINPVISCGSVMKSWQAGIFGFPNPLIGIAAFAVIIVTGVLAVSGIQLPRWYWLGQTIGSLAGFAMVNFLVYSALFRIHALCPYCMVVWVVTPIIMVLSAGRVLDATKRGREFVSWLWVLLPVWYVAVVVAIGVEFWDYWSTLV